MSRSRLAVVGLGGMGGGMAHRLLAEGFPVTVHNRTREKTLPLVADGAVLAGSPAELAGIPVVLLSLSDEAAVDDLLFGRLVPHLRPDTVVVDTSTVSPSYARRAAGRLGALGIRRVEACVVGNPSMARAGGLRIFTAGDEQDAAAVGDVLGCLGQEVRHLGGPGRASVLKLAFNLLLGVQTAALADALSFCAQAGLEREVVLSAIMNSGWRSPVLQFRADFMFSRRYEPAAFRADLMAKDLRLVADEMAAVHVRLPVAEAARRRFAEVVDSGLGDRDAAVVAELAPGVPATTGPAIGRSAGRRAQAV